MYLTRTRRTLFLSVLVMALAATLSACGGGGGGSSPTATAAAPVVVAPAPYNYAALNGRYTCFATGKLTIVLDATFSAALASVKMSAGGISMSGEYKDKVGMAGGYPYYSQFIQFTNKAETLFWYNGQLNIVDGPQANVPDLLGQNYTTLYTCVKG